MLLQGTFGGDFDNFAASGESNALLFLWNKQFKTHWREGLSCSPIRLSAPHVIHVLGRWLFSGRMIRDVSLQRTALESEGGAETSSPSPSPSLMILMFLFVQGLVELLINLVDRNLNHEIRLIRQITLDFHQDCLQLLRLLAEREKKGGGPIA